MDSRDTDLYEDYRSPFDFDSGVNKNYLYLSPSGNASPPGSPRQSFGQDFGVLSNQTGFKNPALVCDSVAARPLSSSVSGDSHPRVTDVTVEVTVSGPRGSGLLKTEPVAEEGEDAVAMLSAPENLSEEEQDELRRELAKVEEEIQTLSQVLAAKEKHLAEIKRKLGISSLQELKQNIAKGWQDVTATSAYKKTSETLSQAGQKASAAFSSVGSVITKKLEDVKNSPTFKSFEEKVENLKSKVGGAKPAGGDFGEVLNSTANATSAEATEPPPAQTEAMP
ncbi:Tumor protein D52 [Microtus ochrogaster]|uniref:Tumor protein D52 n=1 Tax=Microtus ochrogaster TaxID=79684 RepID=A0A8J6G7G0_MICOH|nr:Tumor protein D52 [Microtus ochrogaster]